ncbi:hypothetical protein [Salinibacter ruber]|uniref:hypothetical protein n=1 Tax=Salinibacter ruber TaxID=146919 RepID=UPI00216987A0|nr:hypothetical protein [Salinibacter ruber]
MIVHIGYPKAASTTLQRSLFDPHDGINYFGIVPTNNIGYDSPIQNPKSRYLQNESLKQLHRSLTRIDGSSFSVSEVEARFQEQIEPFLETNRINLFSNERFLSVYFSYPDLEAKACRLKRFVPNARILIVIRNQVDIITSQYRDWPFDPRNLIGGEPVSIDQWVDLALKHDDEIGFLHSLQYDKVVELYEDLFGAEAVSVFCLEQLADDVTSFAKDISSCLQIDRPQTEALLRNSHENRGVTQKRNTYRQFIRTYSLGQVESLLDRIDRMMGSPLMDRIDAVLDAGPKASYAMSEFQKEKIKDFFSRSNRSLEKKHQLPLSKYRYP